MSDPHSCIPSPPQPQRGGFARAVRYFTWDIWLAQEPESRWLRALTLPSRLAFLVVYGFFKDQCHLRATALAYVTILSVAPLLAVAFSISKSLGLHNAEFTRELLMTLTAGRTEIVNNIIAYVESTGVGTLGVVGVLALFAAALSMLNTVEHAFNKIWGVERGRSPWRKLTDYLTVLLISPVLVFAAVSVTVSLHGQAPFGGPLVGELTDMLLKFAPYLLVWLAFFLLYVFVPNTKVPLAGAAVSAVLAGTLWQLAQMFYVRNQADIVTHSNVIYGSFAQFPLFLIWLYFSWVIVLLGAELGYALAHQSSFAAERRSRLHGRQEENRLAVAILLLMAERFSQGRGGWSEPELAARLGAPGRTINALVERFCVAGLVLRAETQEGQTVYVLAKSPQSIRVQDVLAAAEGLDTAEPAAEARLPEIWAAGWVLETLRRAAGRSSANLDLATLQARSCGQNRDAECMQTTDGEA